MKKAIQKIPVITEKQQREIEQILAKADMQKKSPLGEIKGGECPVCGAAACDYADDLIFEYYTPGSKIVISNLTGLRCGRCGGQAYDLRSSGVIEEQLKTLPPAGYEVSISKLGGGKRIEQSFSKEIFLDRYLKFIDGFVNNTIPS
jgi:hypothetical protein